MTEPRPQSVVNRLLELLVGWVVVPAVALTVAYWVTRCILQWRGTSEPTASGWAWIVVAVLGFGMLSAGGGSAFTRLNGLDEHLRSGQRWTGRDREER